MVYEDEKDIKLDNLRSLGMKFLTIILLAVFIVLLVGIGQFTSANTNSEMTQEKLDVPTAEKVIIKEVISQDGKEFYVLYDHMGVAVNFIKI